jgi:hypothetical protein
MGSESLTAWNMETAVRKGSIDEESRLDITWFSGRRLESGFRVKEFGFWDQGPGEMTWRTERWG